jgi:hypothetical protein
MLGMVEAAGFPVGRARYDAAGGQQMRTFVKTAQAIRGPRAPRPTSVPFAQYRLHAVVGHDGHADAPAALDHPEHGCVALTPLALRRGAAFRPAAVAPPV